jgi:hypothetical protein
MTALPLSDSVVLAQQAGKPCASNIKTLCAGIPCKNAMAQTAAGKKILGRGDL